MFHKALFILILSLNFLACSTVEKTTPATTPQALNPNKTSKRSPANNSWGSYHWARTTPQFTLKLGDNLSTGFWKAHLTQASSDWNSPETFGAISSPILTAIVAGTSSIKRCQMVLGTTQVCNSKYGNNGWLGLASINIINGEHITQGSAKMNDTYFSTSKYNNVNEKQHVMCQEIAHTFGLDHQSVDGSSQNSCMDYFSNTGVNATSSASTRPNAHDFDQLNAIYLNLDASTTVAPMTTAISSSEVTDDPNSWGQFMSEKSQGQSSYYERHNKDGSLTITHVYWTQETAARCKNCDHRDDRH